MNSVYFRILTLSTHAKHVCDYITPNYNSMSYRVGIYYGALALYRDLTSIALVTANPYAFHIPFPAKILEIMTQV